MQNTPNWQPQDQCPLCKMGRLDNHSQCNVCRKFLDERLKPASDLSRNGYKSTPKVIWSIRLINVVGFYLVVTGAVLETRPFYEALVGLILILIAHFWHNIPKLKEQKNRDAFAKNVLTLLEENKSVLASLEENKNFPDYSVYLRPFYADGNLSISANAWWGTFTGSPGEPHNLEHILSDTLADTAPLIGIGKTNQQMGPGLVESSENTWKKEVSILIQRSKFIFLIPGMRPGVEWEIDFLFSNRLLHKCIIIVPPPTLDNDVHKSLVIPSTISLVNKEIDLSSLSLSSGQLIRINNNQITKEIKIPELKKKRKVQEAIHYILDSG